MFTLCLSFKQPKVTLFGLFSRDQVFVLVVEYKTCAGSGVQNLNNRVDFSVTMSKGLDISLEFSWDISVEIHLD